MSQQPNTLNEPSPIAEIRALVQRAQQGDHTVQPALRAVLDARPEIWRAIGDMAGHAQETLLRLIAGKDLLGHESIRRKVSELKRQVAGPAPTPLEKLVVERVVLSWLAVHHAEIDAADARMKDHGGSSLSLLGQRRLDSASRRFLQAVRALALIRRLLKSPQRPGARNQKSSKAMQSQDGPVRAPVALVLS
jgi:hypothetical protein